MKKVIAVFAAASVVLVFLAGCGHIADGPGMVNTEYEQGY